MDFSVLGPLAVTEGETPLAIGGRRQRRLLAQLVMRANEIVTLDRLIETVWNGEPVPDAAPRVVRSYVSRLRRSLRPSSRAEDLSSLIPAQPPGYVLEVDPDRIDAVRAERLVSEAGERLTLGEAGAALGLFDTALGLWRGQPYGEFADEEWASVETHRLEALRTRAAEGRIESLLLLGHHADVIGELESLTTSQPLHERYWAQLMLAQYRCSRQADALRTYQAARDLLVEEVGVEPSQHLRELERRILEQDADLMIQAGTAARPRPVDAGRLPMARTPTLGRGSAVRRICTAIRTHRLVTIVGVGGVGKTRVAMEAARSVLPDIAGGVWWTELAPVGDRDDTLAAISAGLGLQPNPGTDLTSGIVAGIRDDPLLLAIDNCEHVIEHVCDVAESILSHCENATILATSREALGLDGELVIPLPPLSLDLDGTDRHSPAVELFLQRAGAAGSGDASDEVVIGEICRRLDGIPLAIEMAASLTRSVTVEEILDGLGHRFDLLAGGRRATDRHRTLRGALQWSYELLDEPQQDLLRWLGVFAGSFTLDDLQRVTGLDYGRAAAGTRDLVEKSLLTTASSGGRTRFRLLETVREFASELLEASGLAPERRHRHAAAYAELAIELGRMSRGPHDAAAVARVRSSIDDFREAFRWAERIGDHDAALTIVTELFDVSMWAGPTEIMSWADDALGIPGAPATARGATALAITGESALRRGEFEVAERLALEAMRKDPAPHRPTVPHSVYCGAVLFAWDGEELASRAAEMRSVAQATGAAFDVVLAGVNQVMAQGPALRLGDGLPPLADEPHVRADALLEEARALGNAAMLSLAHYARGAVNGRTSESASHFWHAARIAAESGYELLELRAALAAANVEGMSAEDARPRARQLLELATRLRGRESQTDLQLLLRVLLRLLQRCEDWRSMVVTWSAARRRVGPWDDLGDPLASARAALDASAFDAADAVGDRLSLSEALEIVRSELLAS